MANPGPRTMPVIVVVRRNGQWEAEVNGRMLRTPSRVRVEAEAHKVGSAPWFPALTIGGECA